VRKDAGTLTAQERADFVDAVLALKTKYEDGSPVDVYDEFVLLHQEAMTEFAIHNGPAFLPWHRAFLDLFERELQTINPDVTIPYWNWAVDDQTTSTLWSDDFMGGNGNPRQNYVVTTGPFRQGQWTLITDGPDLRRGFGVFIPSLPTAADDAAALTIPQYDIAPYDTGVDPSLSFRNYVAGWNSPSLEAEEHNRVHAWVGGSMLTESSPNDPVFWLVHANLDRIWADWEARYGYQYPASGAPDGENLNDLMHFLGVTPASVLNHYDLGYRYDTEPGHVTVLPSAGGPGSEPGSNPPAPGPGGLATGPGSVAHFQANALSADAHGLSPTGTNSGGFSVHAHQFGLGGGGSADGAALLQATGGGDALWGGHAVHALAEVTISSLLLPHTWMDTGHSAVSGGAHAGGGSMDHATAAGDSSGRHKPG
jgi:tyrosinase